MFTIAVNHTPLNQPVFHGTRNKQATVGVQNKDEFVLLVGWLLNVPATCECISGTDLLRQFYVLPH